MQVHTYTQRKSVCWVRVPADVGKINHYNTNGQAVVYTSQY